MRRILERDPATRRPGTTSRSRSTRCIAQIFAATKNKFLMQIMESILADRRAVLFDGQGHRQAGAEPVRQQTHKELLAIVDAIAERNGQRAEALIADHLMRTLATINIWQ